MVDLTTGDIFEGEWENGLKEGHGKLKRKLEKTIIDGIWHEDEIQKTLSCTVNNPDQEQKKYQKSIKAKIEKN